MSIIRDHIVTGNIIAARSLAKNTQNPVARMIDKGIQRGAHVRRAVLLSVGFVSGLLGVGVMPAVAGLIRIQAVINVERVRHVHVGLFLYQD